MFIEHLFIILINEQSERFYPHIQSTVLQRMGRLFSLVKVGTKLGVSGGALYGSHQLGVWGDSKQGEQVRLAS